MSDIKQFNLVIQNGQGDVNNVPYPVILDVDGIASIEPSGIGKFEYSLTEPKIQPFYGIWDLGNLQSGNVNFKVQNAKLTVVPFVTSDLSAFITAQQAVLDAKFGSGVLTIYGSNQRQLSIRAQSDDSQSYSLSDDIKSGVYLTEKISGNLDVIERGANTLWFDAKTWFNQSKLYLRAASLSRYVTLKVTKYPLYYFGSMNPF